MGDFSKGGVHKTDVFWWVLEIFYSFWKLGARGVYFGKDGNSILKLKSWEIVTSFPKKIQNQVSLN